MKISSHKMSLIMDKHFPTKTETEVLEMMENTIRNFEFHTETFKSDREDMLPPKVLIKRETNNTFFVMMVDQRLFNNDKIKVVTFYTATLQSLVTKVKNENFKPLRKRT